MSTSAGVGPPIEVAGRTPVTGAAHTWAAPTPPARRQLTLLFMRLLREQARAPTTYINLLISLFFLAVFTGAFGNADAVERLTGASFLTFILPLTVLTASVSGSIAGQVLVFDLESGYLRRLLSMPLSRAAIVGAAILLGGTMVLAQATLVLGLGLLLGASHASGVLGLLAVLALALLWGLAFAGYSVATGLMAGNAVGAQTAVLVFFPLLFLAPTFLPRAALSGWLRTASAYNPTTYVLEAMRSLLISGWQAEPLLAGFGVVGALCVITLAWATFVANRVTSRS